MQLSFIQSITISLCGLYLFLPVPSSPGYFSWGLRKLQPIMRNAIFGQVWVLILGVTLFLYSYWYALTVVIWYFAIEYLQCEYRTRKNDRELCDGLHIALKQLCNILGSGQLLLPTLCHIADLTSHAILQERLYRLISSLQNNRESSSLPEYASESFPKFDKLWEYFQRIIECGLWYGISMIPLCEAFQKCVEQIISSEEKISAATAGAKMSAILMAFLPGFGLCLGMLIGANPLRILVDKSLGGVLIFAGNLCIILGLLWSRRIINKATGDL